MITADKTKYKTGTRRLGAAIIDTLVFIPLISVDTYVRENINNRIGLLTWLCFYVAISISYSVFMHYKYGQTFGKMAAKIRLTTLDETGNLSLKQALLRDSFYILAETVGLIYFSIQLFREDLLLADLLESFDNFGGAVALVWILLELVTMLTNRKRRAIHDFIAGSVVVKTDRESEKKS